MREYSLSSLSEISAKALGREREGEKGKEKEKERERDEDKRDIRLSAAGKQAFHSQVMRERERGRVPVCVVTSDPHSPLFTFVDPKRTFREVCVFLTSPLREIERGRRREGNSFDPIFAVIS